jgi:hypothetical protein
LIIGLFSSVFLSAGTLFLFLGTGLYLWLRIIMYILYKKKSSEKIDCVLHKYYLYKFIDTNKNIYL